MALRDNWKNFERTVAKFFGTLRNSLSGRNSKLSASDSIHENLFIECKYRAKSSLHSLFKKTNELALQEKKLPVICTKVHGEHGFLITIHSDDLEEFIYVYTGPNGPASV